MARAVSTFLKPGANPYETHPHAYKERRQAYLSGDAFRVLSLVTDEGGCGWYRIRQMLRELDKQNIASTYILKAQDKEKEISMAVEMADVIIYRKGNEDMVRALRTVAPDKPFIFDHDDNTFIIQPSNEHYLGHGTEDVWVETESGPTPVWVHGITPHFDKYENRRKQIDLQYSLEQSDLNTAPTELLAGVWEEYNGNAKVVPNCINFEWYPNVEIRDRDKGDEFRIGWQGGVSHMGDFQEVGSGISRLMEEDKDVVYYSVGSFYQVFFPNVLDRCRVLPWIDFTAHGYRMASLDLDVAVIPLQDITFNSYKSEIKFSEFAAMGVPCVVQNRTPYKEHIQDGITGLLFDDGKEFYEQLKRIRTDGELREKIIKNAYEWVRENRNLATWAPKILDIYKEVWASRTSTTSTKEKSSSTGKKRKKKRGKKKRNR